MGRAGVVQKDGVGACQRGGGAGSGAMGLWERSLAAVANEGGGGPFTEITTFGGQSSARKIVGRASGRLSPGREGGETLAVWVSPVREGGKTLVVCRSPAREEGEHSAVLQSSTRKIGERSLARRSSARGDAGRTGGGESGRRRGAGRVERGQARARRDAGRARFWVCGVRRDGDSSSRGRGTGFLSGQAAGSPRLSSRCRTRDSPLSRRLSDSEGARRGFRLFAETRSAIRQR